VVVAATSIVLGLVACSSGASTPGAAQTYLAGTYSATTPGAIAQMTFYLENHYILTSGNCPAADEGASDDASTAACTESGTFSIDPSGSVLTLSPIDGTPHTLPFHAVLAASAAAVDVVETSDDLHVLGGALTGGGTALVQDGGALVHDGGALAHDGGALVGDAVALVHDAGALTAPCPGFQQSKNGVVLSYAYTAGGQTYVLASAPSAQPDPTQGGTWSCPVVYTTNSKGKKVRVGTFNQQPASNAYYLTTFGCSAGGTFKGQTFAGQTDNTDNCCGAGARTAYAQGLCPGVSTTPAANCKNDCQDSESCDDWRSKQTGAIKASFTCEEEVNWYSTGGNTWGLGTRLCLKTVGAQGKGKATVSQQVGGRGVVVMVYDSGPQCFIETTLGGHTLDVSSPTTQYLFGDKGIGANDPTKSAVFAIQVPAGTPLGPNDDCDQWALDAGVAPGADGGTTSCNPAAPCTGDADCNPGGPLGLICESGTCHPGCHSAEQCPGATDCANGSCYGTVSGKPCMTTAQCNPGSKTGKGALVCFGGQCVQGS
jgi:hypothetical protein